MLYGPPFDVASRSGADDHSRSFSLPQTVASSMTSLGGSCSHSFEWNLDQGNRTRTNSTSQFIGLTVSASVTHECLCSG